MFNKIKKRIVLMGIISIIFLASFPIVMSSEMIPSNLIPIKNQKDIPNEISKAISNTPPSNEGEIVFRIFGFMRFFVVVENNKDEQITVYVNYTMHFGKFGANSTIFPFNVAAKSSTFIFWDCQPMPIYFIKITCEAAGQKYIKNGFTFLGFNYFFPDQ